jgi:hypothetical protein
VLIGFGGISLIGGLSFLGVMAYTARTGSALYELGPVGFSHEGLTIAAWNVVTGSALLISAAQWSRGRWRMAIAIVVVVIAIAYFGAAIDVLPEE